jgi:hypothetical protein
MRSIQASVGIDFAKLERWDGFGGQRLPLEGAEENSVPHARFKIHRF